MKKKAKLKKDVSYVKLDLLDSSRVTGGRLWPLFEIMGVLLDVTLGEDIFLSSYFKPVSQ